MPQPDAAARKPPWCGHCDRRTRLIVARPDPKNPSNDVAIRCQECHPLGQEGGCEHMRPPNSGPCVLCEFPDAGPVPPAVTRQRGDVARAQMARQ